MSALLAVVVGKAQAGYHPEDLLGLIPLAERPAVAARLALELAVVVLEASPAVTPEPAACEERSRTARRLARLLIELSRAIEADQRGRRWPARLVGVRPRVPRADAAPSAP